MRLCTSRFGLAAGAIALLAGSAAADVSIDFTRIEPGNNIPNPAGQFSVTLSLLTPGTADVVRFHVTNTAAVTSSIMEVYFMDGTLMNLDAVTNHTTGSTLPSFTGGQANPENLPGGNTVGFIATKKFSADAGNGGPTEGLDESGDSVDIDISLFNGLHYNDVVNALNNHTLRLGLHVIDIGGGNGGSDSFVSSIVPLPPGAFAGGAMLAGLIVFRQVRRRGT